MPESCRLTSGGGWVAIGAHGWLFWHIPGFHGVRVQATIDVLGRPALVVVSMESSMGAPWGKVLSDGPVTASDLRHLQLGKLERMLARPDIVTMLSDSITLASNFVKLAPPTTVMDAFLRAGALPEIEMPMDPDINVTYAGGDRGDEFYRAIATEYSNFAGSERSPAKKLADKYGVNITTVHRWIKEARKRLLIPPAGRRDATIWPLDSSPDAPRATPDPLMTDPDEA